MDKFAFLTLDLEDLKDSLCFKKSRDGLPSAMDGARVFFSLCEEEGIKGVIFVLANRLEEDLPLLKEAVSKGFEIALHGYEHVLATSYSLEEFISLTKKAKKEVEQALGIEIKGYRAPGWALSEEEHASLRELGFAYSSSVCFTKDWASFSTPLKLDGYAEILPNIYGYKGFYEFALPRVTGGPFAGLSLGGGAIPRLFPRFEVSEYMRKSAKSGGSFILNTHPFEFASYPWSYDSSLRLCDNLYLGSGRKAWKKRLKRYIAIFKKRGYRFLTFSECLAVLEGEEEERLAPDRS